MDPLINLTPEQHARLRIDRALVAAGWVVQSKGKHNIAAAWAIAMREYPADVIIG